MLTNLVIGKRDVPLNLRFVFVFIGSYLTPLFFSPHRGCMQVCGQGHVTFKNKHQCNRKPIFLTAVHHHSVSRGLYYFPLTLVSFRMAQWENSTTQISFQEKTLNGQWLCCVSSQKYEYEALL